VKLDVNPAQGLQSLDKLGLKVQSVLKSNDKMQDCREIERPSRAFKLNRILSTSNYWSAVSTEIHLMLGINHQRRIKLTVQTGSGHIKFVGKPSSLITVSIRAVLCLEPSTNTKWQKPVLVFKHMQLVYFWPVSYNLHHSVTHLTIFSASCYPLQILIKIPKTHHNIYPTLLQKCTVATAVQYCSKVILVQLKSSFKTNFYCTNKQ
jgi:hypothetical protein